MHKRPFEHIYDLLILFRENQVAPRHFVHLSRQREIRIPTFGFRYVEFEYVGATGAGAVVDKCIVIDVFVAQLAESVTTCLVLNHATEIERITVIAHRTVGDSRSVVIHVADASVVLRVGDHDHERFSDVALADGRRFASILQYRIKVALTIASAKTYAALCRGVEAVVDDGIYTAYTRFGRNGNACIDIEIIPIALVGFDIEKMFGSLFHVFEIGSFTDVLGIVAVAEKHDIYTFAFRFLL